MEMVTITNKHGESITLGNAAPYYLEILDGVGGVPINIESQKSPYQDGSTYIDSVFGDRSISIEGMIITRNSSLRHSSFIGHHFVYVAHFFAS